MLNSPITVVYDASTVSPAIFVATQEYSPTSSSVISIIVKSPVSSSTWRVSLSCTGNPSKSHLVDGAGTPSTGHLNRRFLPSRMVTFPPTVCWTVLWSPSDSWSSRFVMIRGRVALSGATRSKRERALSETAGLRNDNHNISPPPTKICSLTENSHSWTGRKGASQIACLTRIHPCRIRVASIHNVRSLVNVQIEVAFPPRHVGSG